MEKKFRTQAKKAALNALSFNYLLTFYPELVAAIGTDKAYSIYNQEKQKALDNPKFIYFGLVKNF